MYKRMDGYIIGGKSAERLCFFSGVFDPSNDEGEGKEWDETR